MSRRSMRSGSGQHRAFSGDLPEARLANLRSRSRHSQREGGSSSSRLHDGSIALTSRWRPPRPWLRARLVAFGKMASRRQHRARQDSVVFPPGSHPKFVRVDNIVCVCLRASLSRVVFPGVRLPPLLPGAGTSFEFSGRFDHKTRRIDTQPLYVRYVLLRLLSEV